MARQSQLDDLITRLEEGELDRQTFLRRAVALGVSTGAATSLAASAAASSRASTTTLRIRQPADPQNMDPANTPGAERPISLNIYEPLVGYKPGTFDLAPVLAETWTPSKNGLRFDFTLRKGVQFHGGFGELTADDVKFSLERIAGLYPPFKSAYQGDFQTLKEVRVTGKYSGSILLNQTFPPLLTVSLPVTGVILSRKAVQTLGDSYPLHPIGTGPYEFVSFTPGQQVVIKKSAKYAGSWYKYIKPVVWDEIDFITIPQTNAAVIAFENGSIDFTSINPSDVWGLYHNSNVKLTAQRTFRYNFIAMNVTNPALADINVRRAIRSAIDVPAILKAAYDGLYTRARAILPPSMPIGYWKDAPLYNRDLGKAQSFLAAAGGNRPTTLSFAYATSQIGGAIVAQIVQSNLNDIGIKVNILGQDPATFNTLGGAAQGARQLSFINFGQQAPEPEYSTVWFTCDQVNVWNFMSWCDQTFTSLHKQAATTVNPASRSKMYIQMQQIWDRAVDAVWIAYPTLYFVGNKNLKPTVLPTGFYVPYNFRLTG
jgi:peptide/nickel transport system substrate-binding protein